MEGRQSLVFWRLRIVTCTGAGKGLPGPGAGGVKGQRQTSSAHGSYLTWVGDAFGSVDLPGMVTHHGFSSYQPLS